MPTAKANTDHSYEIPITEKHLVHVRLESPSFNPTSGERTSTPWNQTFYPDEFDRMVANKEFPGLTVVVLHDPRSGSEIHTDVMTAAVNGPLVDATLAKPVDKMNKAELQTKYADLYKEAPGDQTVAELRAAILEKLEWIRGEESMQNAANANETQTGTIINAKETATNGNIDEDSNNNKL